MDIGYDCTTRVNNSSAGLFLSNDCVYLGARKHWLIREKYSLRKLTL